MSGFVLLLSSCLDVQSTYRGAWAPRFLLPGNLVQCVFLSRAAACDYCVVYFTSSTSPIIESLNWFFTLSAFFLMFVHFYCHIVRFDAFSLLHSKVSVRITENECSKFIGNWTFPLCNLLHHNLRVCFQGVNWAANLCCAMSNSGRGVLKMKLSAPMRAFFAFMSLLVVKNHVITAI